ncbi:MAG: hypothetical protein ACI4MM_12455 [Candidatus Ventricola sp.]
MYIVYRLRGRKAIPFCGGPKAGKRLLKMEAGMHARLLLCGCRMDVVYVFREEKGGNAENTSDDKDEMNKINMKSL